MNRKELGKVLNKVVSEDNFIEKELDEYIYASLSQPPIKIINKNGSDDELEYTVECPTCKKEVIYGDQLFMLSGHHYCINEGCRNKLLHILGKNYE